MEISVSPDFVRFSKDCPSRHYRVNEGDDCLKCDDMSWGMLTSLGDVLNLTLNVDEDKISFCNRISAAAKKQLLKRDARNTVKKRQREEENYYYERIMSLNNIDDAIDDDSFFVMSQVIHEFSPDQVSDIINHLYDLAPRELLFMPADLHSLQTIFGYIKYALLNSRVNVKLRSLNKDILFVMFQHLDDFLADEKKNLFTKIANEGYYSILLDYLGITRTKSGKLDNIHYRDFLRDIIAHRPLLIDRIYSMAPTYGDINNRKRVLNNLILAQKPIQTDQIHLIDMNTLERARRFTNQDAANVFPVIDEIIKHMYEVNAEKLGIK